MCQAVMWLLTHRLSSLHIPWALIKCCTYATQYPPLSWNKRHRHTHDSYRMESWLTNTDAHVISVSDIEVKPMGCKTNFK